MDPVEPSPSHSVDGSDLREEDVSASTRTEEKTKSFTFDQVLSLENKQVDVSELLLLSESVSAGYTGTLLVCGTLTPAANTLIHEHIIKQIVSNLFHHVSREKEDFFISVSFLQFRPDGSAVDFLSLDKTSRDYVAHLVPGGLIRGLGEVCVGSADEALGFYDTCRKTLKQKETSGSLLTVTVEQKLQPESGPELRVRRRKLQLFILSGGAVRSDLEGVNPLAEVVERCESEKTDDLQSRLLFDALNGNSKTLLLYCVQPRGGPDDDTESALALAQKVRGFVSQPVVGLWCPKTTEKKVREEISRLRIRMMSQDSTDSKTCLTKLTELTLVLQIVKDQSWERRRDLSDEIKKQLEFSPSLKGAWQLCGNINPPLTDSRRIIEDQLRREMEEHVNEPTGNVEERVRRIQLLGEALREEASVGEKCQKVEHGNVGERRRQLREAHEECIQEEVEKMKGDLARLPTEGPERELLLLTGERKVLLLQIEALRAQVRQAQTDLESEDNRHREELNSLRSESLQVLGEFRQVSEELRKRSEVRYRSVLLEAVQDAVRLSAQNQQLRADNKRLRKELLEVKDALAARADPSTGTPVVQTVNT